MTPPPLAAREQIREQRFSDVWTNELNEVFADVAPYYDRANYIASLGLWGWFLRRFMATVDVRPGERVLDVCAGTNAIGIALLQREPSLEMHALPFPDNHFDIVTLQFASRHLRVKQVFGEIHRVLKPGGHFHHCDMLRPRSRVVEKMYYAYLRMCLAFTGLLFRSGPAALNCKQYFIHALEMFYSAEELSVVLEELGYVDVTAETVFYGMLGFHRATKPRPD
jgi:demethylmenaquinone methyltransferase/2-methoxy-6-polyprenyl-1,4-benzoquinol methylase